MRRTVRATLAAAGLVAVVGTAIAADMTGDEIKATISGKTVYLECGATSTGGQGQGVHRPLQVRGSRHVEWNVVDQRQHIVH